MHLIIYLIPDLISCVHCLWVFTFFFHLQQIGPIPVEMRNNNMAIALVTRIFGIRLTVDPENKATRNPTSSILTPPPTINPPYHPACVPLRHARPSAQGRGRRPTGRTGGRAHLAAAASSWGRARRAAIAGSGGSMDARAPESAWVASRAGDRRRWVGDMCPAVGAAYMLAGAAFAPYWGKHTCLAEAFRADMAWPAYTGHPTRREDQGVPFRAASFAADKRTGGTRRRTRAAQLVRRSLLRTTAVAWALAPGAACVVSAAEGAAVAAGGT